MTACSICGTPTPTMVHSFIEGLCPMSRKRGERPAREWSYEAALYHHPITRAAYCGPICAAKALAPTGTKLAQPAVAQKTKR